MSQIWKKYKDYAIIKGVLSSIEKLDEFIDKYAVTQVLNKNGVYIWRLKNSTNNDDEVLVTSGKSNYGPYVNGMEFECMLTSGNNLDCLAHAFLMSTCDAFRRRIRYDKAGMITNDCGAKQHATFFRIIVLPNIIDSVVNDANKDFFVGVPKDNLINQLIRNGAVPGDLENEHLIALALNYKINVLLYAARFMGSPIITPRIFGGVEGKPAYIMSNRGGHYESVRESHTEAYNIPLEAAQDIINEVEFVNQTVRIAEYKKGDALPQAVTSKISGINEVFYLYDIEYEDVAVNADNNVSRAVLYTGSTKKGEVKKYLEYLDKADKLARGQRSNMTQANKAKWDNPGSTLEGVTFDANMVETEFFKIEHKPARPDAAAKTAPAATAKAAAKTAEPTAKTAEPAAKTATPIKLSAIRRLAAEALAKRKNTTPIKLKTSINDTRLAIPAELLKASDKDDELEKIKERVAKRAELIKILQEKMTVPKGGRRTRKRRA